MHTLHWKVFTLFSSLFVVHCSLFIHFHIPQLASSQHSQRLTVYNFTAWLTGPLTTNLTWQCQKSKLSVNFYYNGIFPDRSPVALATDHVLTAMMGSEHHQVVWSASFSDGKRCASDHRTKRVNKEAEAEPFDFAALAGIDAESHGLLPHAYFWFWAWNCGFSSFVSSGSAPSFATSGWRDALTALTASFWCLLSGSSLDGQLF